MTDCKHPAARIRQKAESVQCEECGKWWRGAGALFVWKRARHALEDRNPKVFVLRYLGYDVEFDRTTYRCTTLQLSGSTLPEIKSAIRAEIRKQLMAQDEKEEKDGVLPCSGQWWV